MPGFVQVPDERTLAFPDYDGNGMFRSLGNILVNPHVALLFIDFQRPNRLRVNGIATLHADDPLLSECPGAPRYIHKMRLVEYSVYAPAPDHTPPEPEWKQMEEFRDALPRRGGSST